MKASESLRKRGTYLAGSFRRCFTVCSARLPVPPKAAKSTIQRTSCSRAVAGMPRSVASARNFWPKRPAATLGSSLPRISASLAPPAVPALNWPKTAGAKRASYSMSNSISSDTSASNSHLNKVTPRTRWTALSSAPSWGLTPGGATAACSEGWSLCSAVKASAMSFRLARHSGWPVSNSRRVLSRLSGMTPGGSWDRFDMINIPSGRPALGL
mmetsp:Transcript_100163/g.323073  ORF Transcript_100163/g.323073 Transcript_100163/m.323073 type:complete len:213 (+) Transcript_100163:397-1035(+)